MTTLTDIAEALDTAPRWPVPGTDAQVVVLSLREAREMAATLRQADLQAPAPTFLTRQQLLARHPFLTADRLQGYITRREKNGLIASGALVEDDNGDRRIAYLIHEPRFLAWLDSRSLRPVGQTRDTPRKRTGGDLRRVPSRLRANR